MTTWKTKPVGHLKWELLPANYDAWLAPTEKYVEEATHERSVYIMPWHPHVVAEGIVDRDDFNLRRALRDEGII